MKNDPFLPYRILRDYYGYYYTSKGISELRVVGKFYELDYTFNGVNYTKRFTKTLQPSTLNIIKIYTIKEVGGKSEEIDVTSELQPYLGVNKDFHSATPALLGYENLHFITEDICEETNDIITFEKNSTIRF